MNKGVFLKEILKELKKHSKLIQLDDGVAEVMNLIYYSDNEYKELNESKEILKIYKNCKEKYTYCRYGEWLNGEKINCLKFYNEVKILLK